MNKPNHFSTLYDIAKNLNKEFSLPSALRNSLEKTCEILQIETGWIWLTAPDNKSVFLAASYNLPPALKNHPERLSGWCYCIEKYFSDDINEAINISEIACTRLRDVVSGTNNLKFHATIPIIIKDQKVGLLNLLTKESSQINEEKLALLNTISQLIGAAVQRTRFVNNNNQIHKNNITTNTKDFILKNIDDLLTSLDSDIKDSQKTATSREKLKHLRNNVSQLFSETEAITIRQSTKTSFQFPEIPISKRELEVLQLIKEGLTNDAIGNRLCITERTVKFHITSILSKLNANNRTQAVDIALKRGILSI